MPQKDGTGKDGKGPLTGKQQGHCPGADPKPGPSVGGGQGKGTGNGNGNGHGAGNRHGQKK